WTSGWVRSQSSSWSRSGANSTRCRSGLTLRWSASRRSAIASSDRSWLPSTVTALSRSECTRRRVSSDSPPRLTRSPQNHRRSRAGSKAMRSISLSVGPRHPWRSPIAQTAMSVQGARNGEGERRNRRVETRTVVADHAVAAFHAADRGFKHGARGVGELVAGLDQRLLAHHAIAADLFHVAVAVGDHPVPIKQLRGATAEVADANRVGEDIAIVFGRGFLGKEARRDLDLQGVVGGVVHQTSVSARREYLDYAAGAALARRTKSATSNCSARSDGSMPAATISELSHCVCSELRRVLRRCPKAARTIAAKRAGSSMPMVAGSRGTRRTTAESTFGGGLNAPGPTANSAVTWHQACSITLSRPYTLLPGPAAMRSTTSFCSMKCMSRTAAAWSRAWNRIGEDRL